MIVLIIFPLLLRFLVFQFIHIDGDSMYPTLSADEYVLEDKTAYWFSEPQRGDIVVCSYPGHRGTSVKRVIGIEDDSIRITDGILYVNGEAVQVYFGGAIARDLDEIVVPEGCVFVMGDNANRSMDSRDSSIGPIPISLVQGKVTSVIWPPSDKRGL